MTRYCGTVLVDTNVILEAHRTGTWRALAGGYRVETVEECVTETQTGFQLRRTEWQIDGVELRNRLSTVHAVKDLDRARLAVRVGNIALDEGEASLWAHALNRTDDWVLCGPDKAKSPLRHKVGVSREAGVDARTSRCGREPAGNRSSRGVYQKVAYENARRIGFRREKRSLMTKAPNAFPRNMGGVRGNYSEIPNSSNGGQMAGHGHGQYRTTTEGCPYGKNRQSMGCNDYKI